MSDERQRADGGAASGVDSGGEALTDSSPTGPAGSEPIPDPWLVHYAVYAYLIVMPVGHLVVVPVNGAMATLTDVFLGLVVLAGSIELTRVFPRSSPELCVKVRGSSSMLLLGCLGDLLRFEKREIQVATFAPDRSSP